MPTPRKLLAIKLRSLGDTILMTAPLLELRAAYPEAEIHVAVSSEWAPLLERHPGVNRIWNYERRKEATARAKTIARLALSLRRERFDTVVNFHASPSSATLAYATGAGVRSIHFHGHNAKNRYSTVDVPGKGTLKPIIERDMDTVRALGVAVPEGRLPQIFLTESEKETAADRLMQMKLIQPVLGLGLGASRPSKSWPIERFAELVVSWSVKTGGSTVAFASQAESSLAHVFLKQVDDTLTEQVPDRVARAGVRSRIVAEIGLPLRQVAAALSQCAVFAGNDSGPKHLAVAVGTSTVTLFGPEDPFEWHPYPRDVHPIFFVEGLPCRRDASPGMPPWCGRQVCLVTDDEQHRCMREIGIGPVLEQCLRRWEAGSRSA